MTLEKLLEGEGIECKPNLRTKTIKGGKNAGKQKIKFSCEILVDKNDVTLKDIAEAFSPFFKDMNIEYFILKIEDFGI